MLGGLRVFCAKVKGLFGHHEPDQEFEDELQTHLRLLTERFIGQGMTSEEAVWAARRQFGNGGLLREKRREGQRFVLVETLWRDVRYGVRQLCWNPLFTTIAVVSLALGIGANTAVFTLLDQLVLRLLPVTEPERLVMMWPIGPTMGSVEGPRASSYPLYQDLQRRAEAFDFVFCRYNQPLALGSGGRTERINGELVSGNYFQALGVRAAVGRVFSPEADDRIYKGHPVIVLSHGCWMSRFGGDRNVVGRKVMVNSHPMEVIGVSALGFGGLDPSSSPDVWVPIQMKPLMTPGQDELGDRRAEWVQVFGRLKPAYTKESARASLRPLFDRILKQESAEPALRKISQYDRARFLKRSLIVETAANGYSDMRQQYSTALMVSMAMAGLILLIACANVASLLIARAASRQREIAVRLAIGAARKTLIRQLLVESVLLSVSAAMLGLVLSIVTTRALLDMLPGGSTTLMLRAEPDLRILLFSICVALVTGLLFGLAPALQGTRLDLATSLKDAVGAVTGSGRGARLRKLLVTAQVVLSSLLLVGAGLFARTLINLRNTRTGFQSVEQLVTFQVDPAKLGYTVPRIGRFYEDVLREMRSIPGVTTAAYSVVPIFQGYHWSGPYAVEGHQAKDGEDVQAHRNAMSPGYWRTMGIPLVAGRDFNDRDRFDGKNADEMPSVAIVNRKFAEHFFGQGSPIGRHIGNAGPEPKLNIRIVGEVEDSLYDGPRDGIPRQVFYAHAEAPVPLRAYFYVRSSVEPAAIFPALRRMIAKLDSSMPVDDMKTVETQLDEALSTERLIAWLSVAFGVLATVLAALGLYGMMAFVVARRTREIGLRMALGAKEGSVLWLVLREALMLVGVGLVVGMPCAYVLSRYVSSELFGVTPGDVWTWAASVGILGTTAVLSGFVPARRASTIDPIQALRYE